MPAIVDFERQRQSMIESQLRPNRVTDGRLLLAMGALPRELFVPAAKRSLAYMDECIEVWPALEGAPARYLLAPMVLARLIQLAAVSPSDCVLDIGCATGYSTAVLSRLAAKVVGLEAEGELAEAAARAIAGLGEKNASIVTSPLEEGYAPSAPYDVILLNGSVPAVPEALFDQLKDGGRLAAVVAPGSQGKAWLYVKVRGQASGLPHFDAGAKPLPGFAPAPAFVF